MGRLPTGPQREQRFPPRSPGGFLALDGDRDGWPQMPPPKGAAPTPPGLAQAKGYPRLSLGTGRKQEFTGHPTGNRPALATFPQGRVESPLQEPLVEGSVQAMQNRMTVYHSMGGIKGSHPDGDYVAPDGHRSRTFPEHLAWMQEHHSKVPLRDARAGAAFSDPRALAAYQVATRHVRSRGALGGPVRSTK